MIEVKKFSSKGRGIIATQNIPKDTLIEIAPVAVIPSEQGTITNQIEVFKYYFVQPSEYEKSDKVNVYLVFGLASLCNHSENSNARVDWKEDEIGWWSHLIAQEDIKEGEEVTLFYTNIDDYADAEKFV